MGRAWLCSHHQEWLTDKAQGVAGRHGADLSALRCFLWHGVSANDIYLGAEMSGSQVAKQDSVGL